MKPRFVFIFLLAFLGTLRLDAPAHAYLDPGTGSMVVQMLLGGLAGVLVIGKLYWARIKALLGRRGAPDANREPAPETDAE